MIVMAMIIFIALPIYLASPEHLMPQMKKRIPEAYEFFERHHDILVELASFAEKVSPEYTDTYDMKNINWDYFSFAQKQAIAEVKTELEKNSGWIAIKHKYVGINVFHDLRVGMYIVYCKDWIPSADNNSRLYFYERIEEDWYLEIFYSYLP